MAKITEYPVTTEIANDDVLLVDGAGGTRGLSVARFSEEVARHVVNDSQAFSGLVGDVNDLKSDLNDVKEVTVVEEQGEPTTTNIFASLTWTSGYMGLNGQTYSGETYRYSNKYPVNPGDVIAFENANFTFNFITAFTNNTAVEAKGRQGANSYTVPDGINYVVLTEYVSRGSAAINHTYTPYTLVNILDDTIDEINSNIGIINGEIDAIEEVITVEEYTDDIRVDIFPSLTWTSGYMGLNGQTYSGETYRYSNKYPVNPGDVIAFENANFTFNLITAFTNNTAVEAKGRQGANSYTVPDGINYVVLTEYVSRGSAPMILSRQEEKTAAYIKPIPLGYMTRKGSMANADKLTLPYMQVKTYNRVVFNANITTFSAIRYSVGSAKVEVNSTNLVITPSGSTAQNISHGLTIGKAITLLIETETEEYINHVRICSDGNVFDYSTKFFAPSANASQYVESVSSELTECVLSWVSETVNAPIWLFGDSYFAWYNNQGWTYYMAQDGYAKNVMLNGFSGQASDTAYTALVNLLAITTPKIVVWCLGMNNPDNATAYEPASAVNASWKDYYDKLLELEKKYGFELVLYTTPTTPKWDNSFKDAIVRASDHRYVEIDKAVRIDNEGHWITGALNSDDTHPTESGAKIIYHRFLADLPEIMCNF